MIKDRQKSLGLLIGERLKLARKEAKLTQDKLANLLGFNSRQILDNIEAGIRKVSAEELIAIMNIFKKPLDYFTDPFLILGDKLFSWRAEPNVSAIEEYELKARNIVGAFRFFCDVLDKPPSPIVHSLALTAKSSYEEAQEAGERIVKQFDLGVVPATNLVSVIEEKLGIHTLYVDAPSGISGAACHLTDIIFIFINRNEPEPRRNYDLAHEFFHVLTWNEIPPSKVDAGLFQKMAPRAEQLADNFAAALLMPEFELKKIWQKYHSSIKGPNITDCINLTAQHFKVSSQALRWRLRNLKWVDDSEELGIDEKRLKWNVIEEKPLLYSKSFVEKLKNAIEKGYISVRRAAQLLDYSIDDMADLIRSYGLEVPFDL